MPYEYDRMFLVEEVVEERLAPRSHPAARRASIDGLQSTWAMETEYAIEPSDRGTTQSRQSAEEGNERDEGNEQNAHENFLVRLHRQLRLMSLDVPAEDLWCDVPKSLLIWLKRRYKISVVCTTR